MDSNVLRPMIMVWPMVSALNRFRSAGSRHGRPPSAPIVPFRATAATRVISARSSYGDRSLDSRVRVVVQDPDVIDTESVDLAHPWRELQRW